MLIIEHDLVYQICNSGSLCPQLPLKTSRAGGSTGWEIHPESQMTLF